MTPKFVKLNEGWNAEPNVPEPKVKVDGCDVLLRFFVNAFCFPEFEDGELGILRFVNCERFRLGSTNDEGWYRGQCRFSRLAPGWGEFYLVSGDSALLNSPQDWKIIQPKRNIQLKHFLFYFRDDTFECVAETCLFEKDPANLLLRKKTLPI